MTSLYVKVTSLCYVASQRIINFWRPFSNYTNVVFNGEQEKNIYVLSENEKENVSLMITFSHCWASLVMQHEDLCDRFFYLTLTLLTDSYILIFSQ